MYIIDESYFNKEIEVPNVNEIYGSMKNLEGFVDVHVRLCLKRALGNVLFSDLNDYVIPDYVDSTIVGNEFSQVVAIEGQTEIELAFSPITLLVFRNGIYQSINSQYTVSGTMITFSSALSAGDGIDIYGSSTQLETGNSLALSPGAPEKWQKLVYGTDYTKSGKTYTWEGLLRNDGNTKKSLLAYYVFSEWIKKYGSKLVGVGDVVVEAHNSRNVSSIDRYVDSFNDFVQEYQEDDCDTGYVSMITFLRDNVTDYPEAPLFMYRYQNSFGL